PVPGKSVNKPVGPGNNGGEDYVPGQIAGIELPPAPDQSNGPSTGPSKGPSKGPSVNDDADMPRSPIASAAPAAVPEPASLLLLLLGLGALYARKFSRTEAVAV